MNRVNQVLLILHYLGLGLGFSASFGNMVMSGLMSKAEPPEKAVFGRVPPLLSRLGVYGLALLWTTGLALGFRRWDMFGPMPWEFYAKIASVVLLTVVVFYIHRLQSRIRQGDAAAAVRIETVGKIAMALAVAAVVFAVRAFN